MLLTFGAELEFICIGNKCSDIVDWLSNIANLIGTETKLSDWKITKECGHNQFELTSPKTSNAAALADGVIFFKNQLEVAKSKHLIHASFLPVPNPSTTHGNGLHIHIGAYDKDNKQNLFTENDNYLKMQHAIGGLLLQTQQFKEEFFGSKMLSSAQRFLLPNDLTVSRSATWGFNNRTTMIRAIINRSDPINNRIEHRGSNSDSNIKKLFEICENGIVNGIKKCIKPPQPVYGISNKNAIMKEHFTWAILR